MFKVCFKHEANFHIIYILQSFVWQTELKKNDNTTCFKLKKIKM